jgi:hypothetical protein
MDARYILLHLCGEPHRWKMPPSTKWLPYLHQSARMGGSLGLGGAGGGAGGDGSLRTGNTQAILIIYSRRIIFYRDCVHACVWCVRVPTI